MEGLGHGAFRRGIGCIGFALTMRTLLEEVARDHAVRIAGAEVFEQCHSFHS